MSFSHYKTAQTEIGVDKEAIAIRNEMKWRSTFIEIIDQLKLQIIVSIA